MNEAPRKFGSFSSSVDPQKLATTVTGVLKFGAGILVYFGVVTQLDANVLVQNMAALATVLFTAWGLIETIFGILRKMVVAWKAQGQGSP